MMSTSHSKANPHWQLALQGAGLAADWPPWSLRDGRFGAAKMLESAGDSDGSASKRRVILLMAYLAACMPSESLRRANPHW